MPHLQVLREARGASERQAGRSQCALVNPAGPSRSLQVSALGSEHPGPQHSVSRKFKRPGVHPEADWHDTVCSSGSVPQSLCSSAEASGRSLQISALGSRRAWAATPHLQALREASWEESVCSGESSRPQAGTFRCLLWDLNSLGHSTWSPGTAGDPVCTRSTQLAPVARSLGSSPEASGGSPQISPLPDPDQPGQQRHIFRSCKRQEGLPGGQLGGVSVLW